MSTFAKVLLATDLSRQSESLTGCLFSLCPDTETEVVLAHVFDDDDDADPDGSSYKKVTSRLEGYENELNQAGYEDISVITPVGEPSDLLTKAAEEHDVDLLLVASHGKGFLQRTFMGSTTYEIAKTTEVPTLIYKEDDVREDIVDGEELLETIVIPTDFSKKSLEALNIVRSLRDYVGKVVFVHVIERTGRSKTDYKEKHENARLFLQELVDELKIFGIEAYYRISKGVASKQIDAICDQEDATLIMMAKTGNEITNVYELGSTAENVVLNGDCPILLLPAADSDDD